MDSSHTHTVDAASASEQPLLRRKPGRGRLLAVLSGIFALILACQVIPTPPPLKATPRSWIPSPAETRVPRFDIGGTQTPASREESPGVATDVPGELPVFPYQPERPFAIVAPMEWTPSPGASGQAGQTGSEVSLPVALEQVTNRTVTDGLTMRQRALLAQNGFVILHSQEAQFGDIRHRVAERYGQPYYLTSDAAYHALYLALGKLVQALEREELHRRMQATVQATLQRTLAYLPAVQGGPLEADTRLAAAYLSVALKLFDPQTPLDPAIADLVTAQIEQIMAANGESESILIPGYRDHFEVYRPAGHYAGDPALEAYYRGMTWLSRAAYPLQAQFPGDTISRAPLILTLALRQAATPGGPADQEWAQVYETLRFFNTLGQSGGLPGPASVQGSGNPATYALLMDRIYGREATMVSLSDENNWELFRLYAAELPQQQAYPGFAWAQQSGSPIQSWHWLDGGFQMDTFLLNSLVYPAVGSEAKPRLLPGGLDIMAVLGSPAAWQALGKAGEIDYPNFTGQTTRLQENVAQLGQAEWLSTANHAWLYALQAQLAAKGEGYLASMRTDAWAIKDLNSALGCWAELQRSPPAVARQAPGITGNEHPVSAPAPAYVEPNPQVFYRLSQLANVAATGLTQREMTGLFSAGSKPDGLSDLIVQTLDLGDRLARLGDIAASELTGVPPGETERALILAPLGPADGAGENRPAMTAIASLTGAQGRALQVGNGAIDRIYVIVSLDGKLNIAQGGVFSYYEFPQARSGALSDLEWRQTLVNAPPQKPAWVDELYLPDGNPVDVLAFRIGDTYRTTPAAGKLNIRQEPQRFAKIVHSLRTGEYLQIAAGPHVSGDDTWWQVRVGWLTGQPVEGWVIENQEWFERAW